MLKELLVDVKPITDGKTKWLTMHRPSVAMLLCVCSGPWKIERRQKVQENAIRVLGKRDLIELRLSDIHEMVPLEWQRNMLRAITRYEVPVDTMFAKPKSCPEAALINVISIFLIYKQQEQKNVANINLQKTLPKVFHKLPKVMKMFVRDFLMQDCIPIDRHVRRWLKDHNLPTRHAKLLLMFKSEGLHARYYARALFHNKAKNPVHKATKII